MKMKNTLSLTMESAEEGYRLRGVHWPSTDTDSCRKLQASRTANSLAHCTDDSSTLWPLRLSTRNLRSTGNVFFSRLKNVNFLPHCFRRLPRSARRFSTRRSLALVYWSDMAQTRITCSPFRRVRNDCKLLVFLERAYAVPRKWENVTNKTNNVRIGYENFMCSMTLIILNQ